LHRHCYAEPRPDALDHPEPRCFSVPSHGVGSQKLSIDLFQHGGLVKVRSIAWQETKYREPTRKGEQADIAVLALKEPITGIAPKPINGEFEHCAERAGDRRQIWRHRRALRA
jgi:hypothetical protein